MSSSGRRDPLADLYGEFGERLQGDRWQPDVDVFETEKDVVVRVEIAGVRSQDLRVSVDGPVLRVSGVRAPTEISRVQSLHQMEIASGPFERRVAIPVAFDRDRVSANLADGFLTVTFAKQQPVHRNVKVESG